MPIYDFTCDACGKTFELVVLGSSEPECASCGSTKLTKLISTPAATGQSAALVRSARAQAAREGHFSNYSAAERSRM
ncbi:MAG TPA: zinc ribbon domain-containing protein [Polyangiales bacterium]